MRHEHNAVIEPGETGQGYRVACPVHGEELTVTSREQAACLADTWTWCSRCIASVTDDVGGPPMPAPLPSPADHTALKYRRRKRQFTKAVDDPIERVDREAVRPAWGAYGSPNLNTKSAIELRGETAAGERAGMVRIAFKLTWTDLLYATAALHSRGMISPTKERIAAVARQNLAAWGRNYRERPEWNSVSAVDFARAEMYVREAFGPQSSKEAAGG